MTRLLRFAGLTLLIAAAPVRAQTYDFFSQAALADGGPLTEIEPDCFVAIPNESETRLAFFDDTSDQILVHFPDRAPGERTIVLFSAMALTTLTGGATIDRCRDAVSSSDGGDAFFVVADAQNVNYVLGFGNSGPPLLNDPESPVDDSAGIVGVALSSDEQTLYLTRAEFSGAPEDGVYALDINTGGQTPTVVYQNADLDLNGLVADANGDLYAVSSEFATDPAFANVIVKLTDPGGTPVLTVVASPCTDGLFTGCTGSEGGGLEDLVIETNPDDATQQRLFVSNNAFDSDEGVQVGGFALDGTGGALVFTSAALVEATEAEGFTVSGNTGYIDVEDGLLYVAGRAAFGGTPGVASVTAPFPPPVSAEPAAAPTFALAVAPNPAAGAARVAVTAAVAGALTVDVLDLLGRRVATLFEGAAAAGQTVTATASGLAPGVYVVRAQSAAGVATRRLTVLR